MLSKKAITTTQVVIILVVLVIAAVGVYYFTLPAPVEKVTLKVAMIDEIRERKIRERLSEFYDICETKFPGVEVEVVIEMYGFEDLFAKCLAVLETGSTEYDVLQYHHPDMALFEQYLFDLSDWMERDREEMELDDIHPLLMKTHMKFEGKWWGVPTHVNPMALAYRTDLFAKYGYEVPKTFDEMIAICEDFEGKEPGVYGVSIMLKKDIQMACTFLNFMGGHDVYIYERVGDKYSPVINSEPVLEALDHLLALAEYAPPGATTYGFDENMMAFARGEAAMTIMWSSILSVWDDPATSDIVGKYALAPMPGTYKDGVLVSRALLGGWSVSIPAACTHKEEAWEFLKWIVSPKLEEALVYYYETCRISLMTDPAIQAMALNYKPWYEMLEAGPIDFPGVPPGDKIIPNMIVLDHMMTKLNEVVTGITDAETAFDALQSEYMDIFEDYDMLP